MYDDSVVLNYDGKDIWIKNISDDLYFINGCIIGCKNAEKLDAACLAEFLDNRYSPSFKNLDDNYMFVCRFDSDGYFSMYPFLIFDNYQVINMDILGMVRAEYEDWLSTVKADQLYFNDYRNMADDDYIKMCNAKWGV